MGSNVTMLDYLQKPEKVLSGNEMEPVKCCSHYKAQFRHGTSHEGIKFKFRLIQID